jgi:hypothetical protein
MGNPHVESRGKVQSVKHPLANIGFVGAKGCYRLARLGALTEGLEFFNRCENAWLGCHESTAVLG